MQFVHFQERALRPGNARNRILLIMAVLLSISALWAEPSRLVTGKKITLPPLGTQQDVGSLPMNIILSPDKKFAITSDMGLRQSLWSISTVNGLGVSNVDFPNNPGPDATTNGLYYGLVFGKGNTLYAAQGSNDSIDILTLAANGQLTETGSIKTKAHDFPSGLAFDSRGYLYVANNENYFDFTKPSSVAIYDTTSNNSEIGRYQFSAAQGLSTPNFPLAIAVLKDGSKLYVASQRDGVVYILNTSTAASPSLAAQIPTGSHPVSLVFNSKQSLLYVANAHSDTVSVVNTSSDKVVGTVLLRPAQLKTISGATPVGLGLAPDQKTLYVALGDMNAIAVVDVSASSNPKLLGYIPTGWYPTGVVVNGDGSRILFSNAKGTRTRNPDTDYQQGVFEQDPQYIQNIIEGNVSLVSVPKKKKLAKLTEQVLANNNLSSDTSPSDGAAFDHRLDFVGLQAGKITHVIYIIKENRTFDQVLADLGRGNGDPSLTLFGWSVTPNQHNLALRFLLLDNFYDAGEVSGDGWPWSTQSMANEYVIKNLPYNYSDRGRNYDFEGQNNGYLTGGFPAKDPDGNTLSPVFPNGLPPITDAAEAPGHHLWDAAKAAKISYRNYGFFSSFGVSQGGQTVLPDNYPASAGIQPPGHDLAGVSDFDYRRYDNDYPDSEAPSKYNSKNFPCAYARTAYGKYNMPSRFSEWNREFQEMLKNDPSGNSVPALMTVRFNHDHTQGFTAGKFTPLAEVADNDYAVGQLVETISNSPIWDHTAIFIVEDDAQDGPDHVDAHRSTGYVISPYLPGNATNHRFYNTDSFLKTMEMLLGIPPLTQYDAAAEPILDFVDSPVNDGPYEAILPSKEIICDQAPKLALKSHPMHPLMVKSAKMDFDHPDSAPSRQLNEVIWKSVKGMNSQVPKSRHTLFTSDLD